MNRLAEVEVTAPAPVRLFALATGVIVVSLYLPQPLVGLIGTSLALSPAVACERKPLPVSRGVSDCSELGS